MLKIDKIQFSNFLPCVFEKGYSILTKSVRFEVATFKQNRKLNGTNGLP